MFKIDSPFEGATIAFAKTMLECNLEPPPIGSGLYSYPRLEESQCVTGPCVGVYENLIPLFNTSYRIRCSTENFADHYFPSPTWETYGKTIERPILFTGVLPTNKTLMGSLMKLDVKPVQNLTHPEVFQGVIENLKYVFEPYFATDPDVMPIFTMDTSASFPFPQISSCKTKADILSQPWFYKEYVDAPFDKITWWRGVPKHEFLSIFDIRVNGKIRTFLPSPIHLLFWQKTFFGPQDENLKRCKPKGIRYGIDFHHGGFDLMIKEHYNKRGFDPIRDLLELVFMECDISGWDRRLSVMKEIYEIRKAFLKCPISYQKELQWTIKNTLESKILMPNGDVVQKVGASNCSGSGTTTTDNCIGHVIINEYSDAIMEINPDLQYPDSSKLYNELSDIFFTWSDIYGDDILKSYSKELWDFLADGSFITQLYLQFNLIVKQSAFKVQKGPIGMTFLGAKVVLFDNHFLPAYDSNRIYTALVHNIEDPGKAPDIEATKAYSLMLLAWNDVDLFNAIRQYLLNLLKASSVHGDFLTSLAKRGLPSRMEVIYTFWLGNESASPTLNHSLDGGRFLKEVVEENHNMIQLLNSFKQNEKFNDGSLSKNEALESSVYAKTQTEVRQGKSS